MKLLPSWRRSLRKAGKILWPLGLFWELPVLLILYGRWEQTAGFFPGLLG